SRAVSARALLRVGDKPLPHLLTAGELPPRMGSFGLASSIERSRSPQREGDRSIWRIRTVLQATQHVHALPHSPPRATTHLQPAVRHQGDLWLEAFKLSTWCSCHVYTPRP